MEHGESGSETQRQASSSPIVCARCTRAVACLLSIALRHEATLRPRRATARLEPRALCRGVDRCTLYCLYISYRAARLPFSTSIVVLESCAPPAPDFGARGSAAQVVLYQCEIVLRVYTGTEFATKLRWDGC